MFGSDSSGSRNPIKSPIGYNRGRGISLPAIRMQEDIEQLVGLIDRLWRQLGASKSTESVGNLEKGPSVGAEQMLDVRDIYLRVGDSMQRVKLVLGSFLECFEEELELLRVALASGSSTEVQACAHALRGLLLEVSARVPAGLASELESLPTDCEAHQRGRLVKLLSEQVAALARLIERTLDVWFDPHIA